MSSNLISLKNVSRSFSTEKSRGVFDVSFEVNEGEVICILGPSGSGKSTLLRMIADLEKKDAGEIIFRNGADIPGNLVYVPQDYTLWPHLTVLENISLAPEMVKKVLSEDVCREAKELLRRFGLAEYERSYPHQLSGGQKQRVALLRAIIMKPKVLMLDEITSALDPELTKSVFDAIRALAKDGYTMIVVTHHIPLALAIADRIIFLENGKVIQDSSATEFFQHQKNPAILSFIKEVGRKDHAVEVFEGIEQFQAYHLGLLKRLPEGSTVCVAGSVGNRWYDPMGEFYSTYEKLRIQKNIIWKMAMYEFDAKDKELLKKYPAINQFRLLPKTIKNPANYNVMGDTVIIQIFEESPTILEIKDSSVAQAYSVFFEELWDVSSEVK